MIPETPFRKVMSKETKDRYIPNKDLLADSILMIVTSAILLLGIVLHILFH